MIDTLKAVAAAMKEVVGLNESHGVKVSGGKKYTQVVHRVEVFRKHFGLEYGIDTQVTQFGNGVIVKAYVMRGADVIGSGHAYATSLAKEKSLEKLESTAIGRAMASCGLSGGEYATDNEIDSWADRYSDAPPIRPFDKTGDKQLDDWWKGASREIEAIESLDVLKTWWEGNKHLISQLTEDQRGVLEDRKDMMKGKLS